MDDPQVKSHTLTEIIDRFVAIGNAKYNGKIHDNVLNIFFEMDLEDQKNLLRGVVNVRALAVTADIFNPQISDAAKIPMPSASTTPKSKTSESGPTETSTDSTWLYQVGTVMAICLLLAVGYASVNNDPDSIKVLEALVNIISVASSTVK